MHSWLLLVFTLAVPLATSRTEAQSITTSSAPNITDTTTNTTTAVTAAATTNTTNTITTTAATNTTAPYQTTIIYVTNSESATPSPPVNTVSGGTTVDTTLATTNSNTPSTPPPSSHPPLTTDSIPSTPPPTSTLSTSPPGNTSSTDPPPSNSTSAPPPPPSNSTTIAATGTPSPPPSANTTNTSTPFTTTLPPTPTPPPPGPTAPLVCENGGILLQSVCICPDEWTGETCSQANFCPEQQLGEFSFPRTPIGWFAYSDQICPQGTKGAGKPRATTRCVLNNGSPSFERVQEFKCDTTLSDLQQNLTSPADFESLAASAQILTSNPGELTAEDVTAAAQIANTLLLSPNATESVRVAAVATVSQLLNTSTPEDGTENNATLGLTVTLDELSVSLSLTTDSSASQMVQPNLAVQSAQVPAADTQGVQFTSLSGTSGSFIANRIKLNTNASSVVVEEGGVADTLIYVRFPPEAVSGRQKPSNVSLGFVLYQNDNFFRSRRYKSKRSNIRVLSGSVSGQDRSVVPQHVEMMFRVTIPDGKYLHDFACVFWDYNIQDWSTDGCSKVNSSDGQLRCFCSHTTNFAALFSLGDTYEYAALDWISVVGLSISIICLIITIAHDISQMFNKKEIENIDIAPLCTYISLLAFIITFVSGVVHVSRLNDGPMIEINTRNGTIPESDVHVEPDGGSCTAVAALLHFFLLANFMWNSLQGTMMLLLLKSQDELKINLPPYWTPLSFAVGWGVPAVIMAITLGATYRVDNPLGYRQEEFCWLAALDKTQQFDFGKPMFGAFILPVSLIMIYNIVVLVVLVRKDLKDHESRGTMSKVLFTFSLPVVMGVSWTLGYLVLVTKGQAHLALSIIFCLCTTTQGLQIFILITARKQSFRDIVFGSARFISSNISRSPQYISSMASRSAQSISSNVSQSAQRISSINIGIRRGKYRFNMNTESTGGDEYFRFRGEPITLLEFSPTES